MSCGCDHDARRAALLTMHGKPRPVPAAAVLGLLGRRADVHPRDAVAFAYRDQQAADTWTRSTELHYGIPCLGTAANPDGPGVLGAYDLRPALTAHDCPPTDPALPDGWTPPPAARHA